MERAACGLCGADDAVPVVRTRDWSHGLPGEFVYVRCRRCGLVYLNPRPDAARLASYYPPDYSEYRAVPVRAERGWWRRVNRAYGMRKRTRLLTSRLSAGRVLDVGCGAGVFLDEMRRLGWQVQGEDTSADAAAAAGRLGIDVFHGPLVEARFPDSHFDAVTLWNVIEHVPDPLATLREVARVTRPGGLVVLSTPNAASPEARLFGGRWALWEAPRHLQLFAPTTIGRALETAGFGSPETSFVFGAWWGFLTSVQYVVAARRGRAGAAKRHFVDAELWVQPLRAMVQPYLWLLDRLGMGSTMVAVAVRR